LFLEEKGIFVKERMRYNYYEIKEGILTFTADSSAAVLVGMSLVTRAMNPTFPRAMDIFKEAVE
jgi:hypothetical protein